jgi:hypothetical protein
MAIPEGERKTSETREAMVERLRSSNDNLSKQAATKIADDSLRRVEGRIERGTLHRDRPPKP